MYEIINVNGVTFIFSPFTNVETASLGVFLPVGSRFETNSTKGIAHFLEHMLFKGSANYSYRRIKEEVEGRGGSLNAFTSQEITAYYAVFLNKNLPLNLDILLDMVFSPLLKERDIERERAVILEEIKMYNDLPVPRAIALLDSLLWKNHPLGEEIIGRVDTVKKISHKDLKSFSQAYYIPSNAVVSFGGNFSKSKIIGLIKKKVVAGARRSELKIVKPSACRGINIKTEKKELQQCQLCLGFRAPSFQEPHKLAIQLIHVIMGANMSSRFFEELREKKSLCYDISTEVRRYHDSGAFLVHMGLDKTKVITAIRAILNELTKLKKRDVPAKELLRAKDYLLGQTAMSFERPQGRMFYLAESYITEGEIYDFAGIKKKIEKINSAEIKQLASNIFSFKDICISCVGNIDDKLDEEIKCLKKTL
ncbi:MAG: pitrilysin family protein [Candidatus Omnitrophica bacterium]|nr:pitrilysin family protein [Candidatus Omnitrophota bacterium]MDD5429541.1 pitrilysin family protein [Candidatus Omnitrophota bacterium]